MLNQNKEKVKIEKLKREITVLNKERRKLAENLSALRLIISEINRGPDVDKILNLIIEKAVQIVEAERGSLMLFDSQSGELYIKSSVGLSKKTVSGVRIKPAEGIAGWVFKEGKPLLIEEGAKDPRFKNFESIKEELKSMISVPLKIKDKVIGVINVGNRLKGDIFDSDDLKLLSTFADEAAIAIENAELHQEVKDELRKHTLIYKVNNIITSTLDLKVVLDKIVESVREYFEYLHCAILLLDEQKESLYIAASDGYLSGSKENFWIRLGEGVTGKVAAIGKPLLLQDVTKFKGYIAGIEGARSELAVPLKVKDKLIGVLNVESKELNAFDEGDLKLLLVLSTPVAIAIQNAQLHQQIKNLAITDELTGLYNFRYLIERLEEEIKRTQRYKRSLALIMADIDHFKKYNDSFGHLEGNKVLKVLADILKVSVREVDIVGRYGGEEFIIILPEAGKEEAREIAERMRFKVERYKFINNKNHPNENKLTLSLGVTSCFREFISLESLIYKVDQALYQAKRKGRNRVEVI
jgi:diguanylate cyclase (GGDEF)-like protein